MPTTRSRVLLAVVTTALVAGAVPAQNAGAQGARLSAKDVFDPERLLEVSIEVAKADWDKLRRQTRRIADSLGKLPAKRPFGYFKANVTINGVRIENVGLRKKGFIGSLDSTRPSLKIKFDEFQKQSPAADFDRLTLNNNKQDRALLSQFLFYKMHREAGLPAPRCNHAKVSVNGVSLGIYSNVESIRRPFLKRAFGDDSGDLYEGTVADFFVGSEMKFEPKMKTNSLDPIRAVAAAVDRAEVDLDRLEQLLDMDAFLAFWALESLTGFWDGYAHNQNNFFVYRAPKNQKLYFIPWGADAAFQDMWVPDYRVRRKSVHHKAILPNRLYEIAETRKRYRATLERFLKDAWVEERLFAEIDRVSALVKDHTHRSQRDFGRAARRVKSWIKKRRSALERELEDWPVELVGGPRLPLYFEKMGEAKGSFSTTYHRKAPSKALAVGKASLTLEMDGKVVEFEQLGVASSLSTWPTMDGGPKPPTIVFTGKRASDGQLVVLALSSKRHQFRPTKGKERVALEGVVIVGRLGWLNPKGFKLVSGTATLEAAAMKEGAPVKGTLEVRITRREGGDPVTFPRKK